MLGNANARRIAVTPRHDADEPIRDGVEFGRRMRVLLDALSSEGNRDARKQCADEHHRASQQQWAMARASAENIAGEE